MSVSATRVPYAGLATRALALALDVAIVQVLVFSAAAVLALVGSIVGDLQFDKTARLLAAAAWAVSVGSYFVFFWSVAGQTPAMRIMDIRVRRAGSTDPPSLWRSIVWLIGLGLAIIPFFAGFLPVLVDDRRRGLLDMMARTTVVYVAEAPGGR